MPYRRLLAAAVIVAAAVPAAATSPWDVFAADGTKIRKVNFDGLPSPVETLNADTRGGVHDLAMLDDGLAGINLVACETPTDKLWYYATEPVGGVSGTELASYSGLVDGPDGISTGLMQELYLVNSESASPSDNTRELWRIDRDCPACPGGYGTATLVDGTIPAQVLTETLVVRFTPSTGPLAAGDVLVLSRRPGKVWRYAGGSAPRSLFIGPGATGIPTGTEPTGFAFSPRGELLVATASGSVLRFDTSGTRVLPDFATGLGGGRLRIAVAIEDGVDRAFVSDRSGGRVLRFGFAGDGTGVSAGIVTGLTAPLGITSGESGAAPVGAGFDQVANPLGFYQIKFEEVTSPGLANARLFLFADPAPGSDRWLDDVPGLLAAAQVPDRFLPSYVRALDLDGVPTFVMLVVEVTAGLAATQQHRIDIEDLGFVAPCFDDDNPAAMQPRMFYATDGDDPPVIEGDRFFDITTGCSSSFGRGGRGSLFLVGWDSRAVDAIVAFKMDRLHFALFVDDPDQGGLRSFIDPGTRDTLLDILRSARDSYLTENLPAAQADIESFIDVVLDNPGDFDDSSRNVSGELVARAESLYFIVCGAVVPTCNRLLP